MLTRPILQVQPVCAGPDLLPLRSTGPVPGERHIFTKAAHQVTSLPLAGSTACNNGASTSLAVYSSWLVKTLEYLDTDYMPKHTEVESVLKESTTEDSRKAPGQKEERLTTSKTEEVDDLDVPEEEEEDNSCSSSPCGDQASCWNGDGRSFLCTCDSSHPHGNPYEKCVKCVYDSHCPGNGSCEEEQCVGSSSQGPQGFIQVGERWYLISQDRLAWAQAQYSCMNMQGGCTQPNKLTVQ